MQPLISIVSSSVYARTEKKELQKTHIKQLSQSPRSVSDVDHIKVCLITDLVDILPAHVADKRLDLIISDNADRSSPKTRSGHAGTDHTLLLPRCLHKSVKLGAGHLIIIPKRNVRLIHQQSELFEIVRL